MSYKYYRHDGAEFRGPADQPIVNEVLVNGQWQAYDGDRIEPVWYGREIDEAAINQEIAKGHSSAKTTKTPPPAV